MYVRIYVCVYIMYMYIIYIYIYITLTQRAYTASYNHLIHVAAFPSIRRLLSIKMLFFDAHSVIHCPTLSKGSVPQTFM